MLAARRDRGVASRVVTLLFQNKDAVPLGNEPVMLGDEIVGVTTSAAYGYRIGRPLAIASVRAALARDGLEVGVNIAGVEYQSRVVTTAAYDPSGSRMRQ